MRNIKELKKIARKNPGKYVVVSTSENDIFEGVLLSVFLSKEVVKVAEDTLQDSNSDNLISKGIFLFDGTGVNFVFYEGIEVIRVYDSPMFEEDSKKMIGYFKEWLHAHS